MQPAFKREYLFQETAEVTKVRATDYGIADLGSTLMAELARNLQQIQAPDLSAFMPTGPTLRTKIVHHADPKLIKVLLRFAARDWFDYHPGWAGRQDVWIDTRGRWPELKYHETTLAAWWNGSLVTMNDTVIDQLETHRELERSRMLLTNRELDRITSGGNSPCWGEPAYKTDRLLTPDWYAQQTLLEATKGAL